jgi:hypothetical protein
MAVSTGSERTALGHAERRAGDVQDRQPIDGLLMTGSRLSSESHAAFFAAASVGSPESRLTPCTSHARMERECSVSAAG